jgi:metallo-beta-lactamase class B
MSGRGFRGLNSILITSDRGHVLIDGDLPESAPKIAASVRELGFRIEDVKLILLRYSSDAAPGGVRFVDKAREARSRRWG